jgi:tRNA1Val (adenine37-N6)-methyltransferase
MSLQNSTNHLKNIGRKTSTFFFKKFKVEDGRSTMKVGTDAVLLGVVASVASARNILEIGTGCGVISLILAQRSQARIDAIEIDQESVIQASANAVNSPWRERINIIHNSLQDYIRQPNEKYDLVISNPPYFSRSLKSSDKKRNISRHDDSLSFAELIEGSSELMLPGASLWVILPAKEGGKFNEIAGKYGLFVHYQLKIAHKTGNDYQRVILQLKNILQERVVEQTLTIKEEDDSFTETYIELTRDFYIDF